MQRNTSHKSCEPRIHRMKQQSVSFCRAVDSFVKIIRNRFDDRSQWDKSRAAWYPPALSTTKLNAQNQKTTSWMHFVPVRRRILSICEIKSLPPGISGRYRLTGYRLTRYTVALLRALTAPFCSGIVRQWLLTQSYRLSPLKRWPDTSSLTRSRYFDNLHSGPGQGG